MQVAVYAKEENCLKDIRKHLLNQLMAKQLGPHRVDTFTSADTLLSTEFWRYEAIFIDIHMLESSGSDFVEAVIARNPDTSLVLVTAKMCDGSVEYKYSTIVWQGAMSDMLDAFIMSQNDEIATFSAVFLEGTFKVAQTRIVYVESKAHKCLFHLINKQNEHITLSLYEKLKNIQSQLKDDFFVRTHQSYLVGMQYILNMKKRQVELVGGITVPVSQTYEKAARQIIASSKVNL